MRIHIRSFGCPSNMYDGNVIEIMLEESHELTDIDNAELINKTFIKQLS